MLFPFVLGAPFGVVFDVGCLEWIVAGLIGGWLAGLIVRGRGYGCVGDILLGVAGAFVAAILLQIFAPNLINGGVFRFTGTAVLAFVGALLLALLGRLIGGNRAGRSRY
jgi:uncharacterized membrane protein YeaQ/YmgE (transglycosylase-associated protein family)